MDKKKFGEAAGKTVIAICLTVVSLKFTSAFARNASRNAATMLEEVVKAVKQT